MKSSPLGAMIILVLSKILKFHGALRINAPYLFNMPIIPVN